MKLILLLIPALLFYLAACKKFEYSPYQKTSPEARSRPLNEQNLDRLMANRPVDADDTLRVIYIGDSQRFYDELERLVKKANHLPRVDFLVLCGDIADFGLLREYEWVTERLSGLQMPYFCVIGNHDLVADNGEAFTSLFGKKNYAFTCKGYKFLFHDTNGREYRFNGSVPDLGWLQGELADTQPRWMVGVSHVPPFNEDFDPVLELPYKNLFASDQRFIVSLHGHLHKAFDSYVYEDHVRYMTCCAVEKPEFFLLKFIHGEIIPQTVPY